MKNDCTCVRCQPRKLACACERCERGCTTFAPKREWGTNARGDFRQESSYFAQFYEERWQIKLERLERQREEQERKEREQKEREWAEFERAMREG